MESTKRRIFIDMDGVLCEYRLDVSVEDMKKEGFFRALRPRGKTVSAVRALIEQGITDVFVLSAVFPETREKSIAEKNAWLDEHLPEIDYEHRLFPLCGTSKADAIKDFSPDDILMDDYSSNLFAWVLAGGKGIKLLNEVNGKNGTFHEGPRLRVLDGESLIQAVLEA